MDTVQYNLIPLLLLISTLFSPLPAMSSVQQAGEELIGIRVAPPFVIE